MCLLQSSPRLPPRKRTKIARPRGAHLVFVYGTLKSGFWNHGCLHDNDAPSFRIDRGGARTSERYPMFVRKPGSIPFVIPAPGIGYHILGELWQVSSVTLRILDNLEGHPHGYERRLIPVIAGDTRHQAWLYFWPWVDESEYPKLTFIPEYTYASISRP